MKGNDINPQRESDFPDCSIRRGRMINTCGGGLASRRALVARGFAPRERNGRAPSQRNKGDNGE